MIYDLHTHSQASDGILRPKELVSRAKDQDVRVLALTDHDTTAGLEEAWTESKLLGLEFVPGVEFSCQWNQRGIHIVGLNIDPSSQVMCDAEKQQLRTRQERAEVIAQRLAKAGVKDSLEGAMGQARGDVIGRVHFAEFLVEAGYVATVDKAFKKYLGTGTSGDVKNVWPSFEQVIQWIKGAGGIPVLAHPAKYKLTSTKLRSLLVAFRHAGGLAIEVLSGRQDAGLTRDLAALANKYELAASCGSDFHRQDQPWRELGGFGAIPAQCRPVWQLWE